MSISKIEETLNVFYDEGNSFGEAAGLFMGLRRKKGGDSESSGCGCAIFLMLVILGIMLYLFLTNNP